MNPLKRWGRFLAIIAIVLVLGGVLFLGNTVRKVGAEPAKRDSLRTVLEVMALVKVNYVEDVSLTNLFVSYAKKGTISGMISTLKDPYTRYMLPMAYDEMKIDNTGEFGGIGIYLGMTKNEELTVISPIEDTPADRLGVKAGDLIRFIDGRPTTNMSSDEAANLMRGPKGTKVTITVERGKDRERKEFTITRDTIRVPSVKAEMKGDNLGYLRIASFTGTTADDVENALTKLEKQGMQGLVLDLRFNPGGLLNSAADIANKFIDQGPLLHVVGRTHNKQTFLAKPGLAHRRYPIVVLINKGSASAAEILSGALKDTKRAIVVGTTSFGKGSVQTIFPLADGSALALTTQKWLTAGGRSISQHGIEPDVFIKNPGDDEMEQELDRLQAERKAELDGKKPAGKDSEGKKATDKKPDEKAQPESTDKKNDAQDERDQQLDKALEILKQQLAAGKRDAA